MKTINRLKYINNQLTDAIEELEDNTPTNEKAVQELIEACKYIEAHYKQWCNSCDYDFGDEAGTAYRDGVGMEYQIESDWWHDVSLALRKIVKV